ncbi:hypothetical protein ACJ72_00924 [Emergomyces africanus]|uniref:cystathionine gamma-lyase n=1 Tax=Emergomyces africanus TaxID=1955775 RepID=A0A1B7P6S7_9EURO|nr:hypothetical protein ACJ72_00924 [Emergomyces africanus]
MHACATSLDRNLPFCKTVFFRFYSIDRDPALLQNSFHLDYPVSSESEVAQACIDWKIGAVPSAFDCWLAHRGLKTLHLRAREASRNATIIATTLESSPHVIAVNYPGIKSHPHREIALKQHRDGMGGGMLSFRIKGGVAAAERFCQETKVFVLAESLGGVESLVEVPGSMTHAGIPKEQREAAGVFDDLVRVSCGIEDSADLLADVLQALEKAVVGSKINGLANGRS